jgi:hypothetical protein
MRAVGYEFCGEGYWLSVLCKFVLCERMKQKHAIGYEFYGGG